MRFPRSLQWRITLAYTALIILMLGVVSFYHFAFVRSSNLTNLETRLQHEARLVATASAPYFSAQQDGSALQALSERLGEDIEARVTLIAPDGTVLADNREDPASLANQGVQPEFERALDAGIGINARRDGAAGEELIYVAAPVIVGDSVQGVARIAAPAAHIGGGVNGSLAMIALIGLAGTVLAVLIGYIGAARTTHSIAGLTEGARQLAAGELDYRVNAQASDETQELAQAFNRMAVSLRDLVRDLSLERGKLTAVLNTMADGVVVIDGNGSIVLVNHAAEQILNIEGEDVQDRRFTEIIRDHNLQQLVARCTERREVQHGEVEIPQWRRYLSVITTPLTEHDDASVLLTMHDLTRIRQLETTRREFVSNVSHELRGPLAAVKILAESLAGGALKEKKRAKDFLRRINSEIDRMAAMVNELMELSRLESEQSSLQLAPLDLHPLIADLRAEHDELKKKRKVVLDVAVPDSLPPVRGDEEKLRQVIRQSAE